MDETNGDYNSIEVNENIHLLESIKTFNEGSHIVNQLLLLQDNRIAAINSNKVKLFDPSNDYHQTITITLGYDEIHSICQLSNGNIILASSSQINPVDSGTVYIYKLRSDSCDLLIKFKSHHINKIDSVIALPNNQFASCSFDLDRIIFIYSGEAPYKTNPMYFLYGYSFVYSLLYLKERNCLVALMDGELLSVWDMKQCVSIIKGVKGCCGKNMYQIDKDRVIVGQLNMITIVNIDECKIERKIVELNDYGISYVNAFMKIDDNRILCGCGKGKMFIYNLNSNSIDILDLSIEDAFTDLLRLNDNECLSSEKNGTIILWKMS